MPYVNKPSYIKTYIKLLSVLLVSLIFSFCTKEQYADLPSQKLEFSDDTLSFDTVFATMGSTTKGFLVYNKYDKKMKINSINLGGGEASAFRMNIDGVPTYSTTEEVEIWPNDSLYIFVNVTVDPNDVATPFVVEDSILFESNFNTFKMRLVAWGQNANFFGPGTPNGFRVTSDSTWTNNLPYVIYDGVIVDSLVTLNVDPGVEIYMHNGALFYVQGTLHINGGLDSTEIVHMRGTRLEEDYDNVPGQWGTLYFPAGSVNNTINGALIENGYVGIRVDSLPASGSNPNLVIENTTIRNMFDSGILGVTAVIAGGNCLVYNCGRYNLQLEYGGVYAFANCTFYNQNSSYIEHKNSIFRASNYFPTDAGVLATDLNVAMTNCIVYGSEDEEIDLDPIEGVGFDIAFNNCLVKTEISADSIIFTDVIRNPNMGDTLFVDTYEGDFRLNALAPAIDAGLSDFGLNAGDVQIELDNDLIGTERVEPWDIGCYEFLEE